MEAKAIAKYVRMSPIKLKPVADLVRGKDLNEALNILKFTPGKGAEIIEKVVSSAAANADVKEMNTDVHSQEQGVKTTDEKKEALRILKEAIEQKIKDMELAESESRKEEKAPHTYVFFVFFL